MSLFAFAYILDKLLVVVDRDNDDRLLRITLFVFQLYYFGLILKIEHTHIVFAVLGVDRADGIKAPLVVHGISVFGENLFHVDIEYLRDIETVGFLARENLFPEELVVPYDTVIVVDYDCGSREVEQRFLLCLI